MKLLLICIVVAMAATGCATGADGRFVGAGGGSYEYSRTLADGSTCKVSVISGRDVQGGVLKIDQNCAVTSKVDDTQGAVKALGVIDNSISLAREVTAKVP